ncbi:pyridine nucleotide-disulfide oxidoreductase/dicluster-binding protein [Geosporobacter ferrireducens]|uniref:pyridine nucleotide-disulfide oxidoreductase/dicluster-binding protein n=1 Tax=Geosporobacter ferrireducens TaxID=1424294 RepID=UPI00139E2B54|nr:pyridine nucleotide-disulfide oxidoreductase/dicluster-binding protein [Geosporobacter ferrireducens]MTI57771.1 FAD-dependent oxidoreductase [Geosporobacter ferrireducens]
MDLDKLLETGDRCIHDEPPACTASCPVHMDVIAFVREIEKGDFAKAYKLMEKRIPFARIVGMICDHPCESLCVRNESGRSISIAELEKAVISHGFTPSKKTLPLPKNKGKVAIIGGGMSGMTAAYDLDKKGYQVTLYEKSDRLGGRIWSYVGKDLKKEVIEEELQIIEKQGVQIKRKTTIDKKGLEEIVKEYDAVYLGTGEWKENLQIHPDTFQVEKSSVFAGGSLVNRDNAIIYSASSGRRAAISIDRYLGKVSLTASREREGVFDTPLKYEDDDIQPIGKVEKAFDIYTKEEAVKEAERCLKCQCRACIKTCSHMKKFNISPNAYVRQINHNERIILGTHYANKMINSCTLCGLCKEQCFLDISMKDVIQETRESMVQKGKMPVSAHDFALKDMAFSNSERFSMVRKQPGKEQSKHLFYYPVLSYSKYARGLYKGSGKTGYLFYPGCQLSATHSEHMGDIYKHLVGVMKETTIEGDVGIYLGCCGAPADWAGRQDLMQENVLKIKQVWEEMDKPTFILACSSCVAIFEKYLSEIDVVSLWEIFEKYGLPERNIVPGRRVLHIHDACATRYNTKIHDSIRNIAASLGYKIQELAYTKEKTKCCGYGGLVYYANREQAKEFVKDRTNESTEDILVYCAMCKDLFVEGGKRTYHILDLIFGVDREGLALKKMPTLSERHENRTRLKRKLLKKIWGETQDMDLKRNYDFKVIIPEDVVKVMEERYILVEDIERVIDNAKKNKERFFNPEDSNYLARLRLDNVTYWVRYEEKEEGVVVSSVYSHRMEVVEE